MYARMRKTPRRIYSICMMVEPRVGRERRAKWSYLILDKKLDPLNGCSSCLGDGGRHTAHYFMSSAREGKLMDLLNGRC